MQRRLVPCTHSPATVLTCPPVCQTAFSVCGRTGKVRNLNMLQPCIHDVAFASTDTAHGS